MAGLDPAIQPGAQRNSANAVSAAFLGEAEFGARCSAPGSID